MDASIAIRKAARSNNVRDANLHNTVIRNVNRKYQAFYQPEFAHNHHEFLIFLCYISLYPSTSADWKNSNSNGGHRRLCKILRGVDPVVQATPNNMPRLYAGLGYLDEELLLNEMELYSDLFIEESARIGVDSMSLVVLCAEDKNDITRLTVSARFLDGTFQIHEICGVLFKTIDIGRDKLDLIYPRDGGHGSIADDKKSLVVAHLEQFIDKVKVNGIQVVMMTCGRGLTWLASECPETQGRNLPSRMAG